MVDKDVTVGIGNVRCPGWQFARPNLQNGMDGSVLGAGCAPRYVRAFLYTSTYRSIDR